MKGEGHTFNCQSSYMSFELNNNLFFVKKKDKKYYKEREWEKNKKQKQKGAKSLMWLANLGKSKHSVTVL